MICSTKSLVLIVIASVLGCQAFSLNDVSAATQEDVAIFIRDSIAQGSLGGISLWITDEPCDTEHVVPSYIPGEIDTLPFLATWVVMIDWSPDANWGHDVTWAYLNDDNLSDIVARDSMQFPPAIFSDYGNGPRVHFYCLDLPDLGLYPCPLEYIPSSPTVVPGQEKDCLHAILISGGISWDDPSTLADDGLNYTHYAQNLGRVYRMLRTCGYPKDNIDVFYAASEYIGPIEFKNNHLDLDGDGDNDVTNEVIKQSIRQRISEVCQGGDPSKDILFIYVTNHGGEAYSAFTTEHICLWDFDHSGYAEDPDLEQYSVDELGDDTKNNNLCRLYVVMDQCHSGGFLRLASDGNHTNTAIYTAAAADEQSYDSHYLNGWLNEWNRFPPCVTTVNQLHSAGAIEAASQPPGKSSTADFREGYPGIGNHSLCDCCGLVLDNSFVSAATHNAFLGTYTFIPIWLQQCPGCLPRIGGIGGIGGFDFLIAYDASALTFMEASPGQLLDDCGWEYFTYRYGWQGNCEGPCPSGLLRIVAIADLNNGPNHPSCFGPPDTDPHELAKIKFYVTNDRTYDCMFVPIRFFWDDCGDNAVSSITGDTLFISSRVFDAEDNEITGDIHYGGHWWLGDCQNPDTTKPSAIPYIDFIDGGIEIVCADSIDLRGDINLNNVANEIADAVLFTNYFIYGLGVFNINADGQIAATDVNNDGRVLTVGDLVYLVRIITGDALPYAKLLPFGQSSSVSMSVNHTAITVSTNSQADIGAGYFVFEQSGYEIGEPHLINGASDMTLKYHIGGDILKVLVYSMEKDRKIPSGTENIVVIPITGSGTISLTNSELSDYNGNLLTVVEEKQPILPQTFTLHQNYPNPFNATTRIIYEVPKTANVKIEIFNIEGQRVATLVDRTETAGTHTVQWNGTNGSGGVAASGVYIYRMTSDEFRTEKKMVLIK